MFASCLGLNVPLEMASLIMFLTQHLPHNTAIFLTLLITSLFGLFFVFFFSLFVSTTMNLFFTCCVVRRRLGEEGAAKAVRQHPSLVCVQHSVSCVC